MPHELTGSATQRAAMRLRRLAQLDWYSLRHREQQDAGLTPTLSTEQYQELLQYKQALRDWASGPLPTPPDWVVLR